MPHKNIEDKKTYHRNYYIKNRQEILKKSRILGSQYRKTDQGIKKRMIRSARSRSLKLNIPFNITIDDIIIPKFCPILGIELSHSEDRKNGNMSSPSIDRINPSKGYIKGNIIVISCRANSLKNGGDLYFISKCFNIMLSEWLIHGNDPSDTSLSDCILKLARKYS